MGELLDGLGHINILVFHPRIYFQIFGEVEVRIFTILILRPQPGVST
jgi:hypothetical protein